MGSTVASGGFRFSQISVGGTWYWSVVADNITGAGQLYYVKDIETPFGKLTDGVDVPIPGDVVQQMASSMAQFQQQLAPLLALVAGQQTVIPITVTQGDPAIQVGAINVINAGAFGSFMTATATPTVPWLSANPTTVPGIGQNQQAQFGLILDPTTLVTAPTPYAGQINFQDNRSTPTVIPVTVVVTVLPQPVIQTNVNSVALTWDLETAANSGAQQVIVTNGGPAGSILNFTVAKVSNSSPWLTFAPITTTGLAAGAQQVITFSLVPSGIPQVGGEFFETVVITSTNAANSPVAIQVSLFVNDGGPPSGPPSDPQGFSPFGEPNQPTDPLGADWIPGGNYSGGPNPPFAPGPGNQIAPGAGWTDPGDDPDD